MGEYHSGIGYKEDVAASSDTGNFSLIALVKRLLEKFTSGIATVGATLTPLGYAQDTTISAASALPTVPAATTVALIQVTGQDCRWRDDGTNPTASVGVLLGAGTAFWYRGTFSAFRIIETAAGATLNVSYYQEVAE